MRQNPNFNVTRYEQPSAKLNSNKHFKTYHYITTSSILSFSHYPSYFSKEPRVWVEFVALEIERKQSRI